MTKIKCKTKTEDKIEFVKIKIIKAPLINTFELKQIIFARQKAIVL